MKFNVMLARFPYLRTDDPDVSDWLIETVLKCKADERIDLVMQERIDDTPITMTRNLVVKRALERKADYLLMIDCDMSPDLRIPFAKPFWDTSLDFILDQKEPCAIVAPYCGPPPLSSVYAFQWSNWQNEATHPDMRLEPYTREHAVQMGGIQRVAAGATGIILIDVRVFKRLKPPWFYYEWKDETQSQKASTEDVTFTRDMNMQHMPVYCNWDAWAGHWKRYRVDKPVPIYSEGIAQKYREAVLADVNLKKRLIVLGEGEQPKANGDGPNRMPNPLLAKK
jgi:hypothetical protein